MVAVRESAELAERLIEETCAKQDIRRGQLTLHADRGTSMSSKPVAFLLADLGVTRTHSRPHGSDDNPYSESQFRTMYNEEHRHSWLGLLTPTMVALLPNCAHPRRAPSRSRCGLSRLPRTLRPPGSQTSGGPKRGLDQQTSEFR
jgi:transposase InsO family protein